MKYIKYSIINYYLLDARIYLVLIIKTAAFIKDE